MLCLKSLVQLNMGIKPMSTDCEADVLTTLPQLPDCEFLIFIFKPDAGFVFLVG